VYAVGGKQPRAKQWPLSHWSQAWSSAVSLGGCGIVAIPVEVGAAIAVASALPAAAQAQLTQDAGSNHSHGCLPPDAGE